MTDACVGMCVARDAALRPPDHAHASVGMTVLGSVHNIQANVPPENVMALFEATKGTRS